MQSQEGPHSETSVLRPFYIKVSKKAHNSRNHWLIRSLPQNQVHLRGLGAKPSRGAHLGCESEMKCLPRMDSKGMGKPNPPSGTLWARRGRRKGRKAGGLCLSSGRTLSSGPMASTRHHGQLTLQDIFLASACSPCEALLPLTRARKGG